MKLALQWYRNIVNRGVILIIGVAQVFNAYAFERNVGQVHDGFGKPRADVLFMHENEGFTVLLRDNGFSYQLHTVERRTDSEKDGSFQMNFHRIDIDFDESEWKGEVLEGKMQNTNSYFLQGSIRGTTEVFDEVTYREVFPGLDIRFFSSEGKFKYDVICRSREAMERAGLLFRGAAGYLEESGALRLSTRFGEMVERIPASFICTGENCQKVEVTPMWDSAASRLSFRYDGEWPDGAHLLIDPAPQLLWSTYAGGSGGDELYRVASNASGEIYTSGFTSSSSNIATSGAYQGTLIGFQNCFLMKYSSDGQKIWGTYFGGNAADRCYALRLDESSGHLYIGGSTFSNNIGTPGVHQSLPASADDAFLAKFDMQGQLVWCTYFGGEGHDFVADIDLDSFGSPVVTGHTRSATGISTDLTVLPGNENAFIAKFTTDGFQMWGTYFGGWFDEGWGIAVDGSDDIYVCGITSSTTGISTPESHQPQNGGGLDAFLVKYSASGQKLWGTYIGGTGMDRANAIALLPDGSVALAGDTESPTGIATSGAHQSQPGSIDDGFLARFAPDGTRVWGTYVGGGGVEYLHAIKVTASGDLLVTGQSESAENIASPLAFQPQPAGEYDAILFSFSTDGQYLWGTYLGGPLLDIAHDVAVDPLTGHAVIGGMTRSQWGVASGDAFQPGYAGGLYDSFLARLCIPIHSQVQPLDGTLLCGEGQLRFALQPAPSSAIWQNGHDGLMLHLMSDDEDIQTLHATLVDTTGCPGWSDTLTASFFPPFDPEIGLDVSPNAAVCLGSGFYLTVAPQFGDLLWWDGSTGLSAGFLPQDTIPHLLHVTVFNENGCAAVDSAAVQAQICLGGDESGSFESLSLLPNPSDGAIVIRSGGEVQGRFQIEVFSVDGRHVHSAAALSGEAIALPLRSGMYLIRVLDDNGREHHFRHIVR
jgi:hypothetical protein